MSVRGGTSKFYRATTIVLSYALPVGDDDVVDDMVGAVEDDVAAVVERLRGEFADEISDLTGRLAPCDHCRDQKYETYLLLTVLRRAFVWAHVRTPQASE